jgi:hypothetical protein
MLASSVASRLASARTHALVASHIARGLASAVNRKLFAEDSGAQALVASVANHLGRQLGGASRELPVETDAA